MNSRISMDLGNPLLLKLLKLESQETGTSMKDVLVKCLESYFAHKLETKALMKASDKAFEEWHDPIESDYDNV